MENLERLFALYKTVLLAHIGTKTTESQFHEKSEGFYELLFDVFHLVSEKRQDVGTDEPTDCSAAIESTYSALEEAKSVLEAMVKEKNSVGTDNLLRGLLDRLETACGDARAFVTEEEEEDETENPAETVEEKPAEPKYKTLTRK